MTPTGTEPQVPESRAPEPRAPEPRGSRLRAARLLVPVVAAVLLALGVVAFVSAGARGPSGTPSQQLQSWVAGADLGQSIGTLVSDGRNVGRALAAHQGTNALHTVCAVLYTEAQTVNQDLPSPDVTVTGTLARAYGLEYDAGQACYRGAGGDQSLLAESARDRARAVQLFRRVLDRVAKVTGHPVSTTTTTGPGAATATFL